MMRLAHLVWIFLPLAGCGGTSSDDVEDCNGVAGGDAVLDECGTCDEDPYNDCEQDCRGDWGGPARLDDCNTCDDDPDNDCVVDCAGELGGPARLDQCNTCDDDPGNDCVQDCAGEWGGAATLDACDVCDDDPGNDCLEDCAGDPNGGSTVDQCGVCDDDPDNDCVQDCAGEWGGGATEDLCGACDADPANDCVEDCMGVLGGPAYTDNCGLCIDRGAVEAAVLWGDDVEHPLDEDCRTLPLNGAVLAEGISLNVASDAAGQSDVSVTLIDVDGNEAGVVELAPANYEALGATEEFEAPIVVESLIACSAVNPARLIDVAILGSADACRGDCAGNWPGARAYRDSCGTCIDRDAAPPEIVHADRNDYYMSTECTVIDFPGSFLVEEVAATVQNVPGAISDAWIFLRDEAGADTGSIELNPADMGTVSESAVFDPPIAVSSMNLCSWWNPANLLDLELWGDPNACEP